MSIEVGDWLVRQIVRPFNSNSTNKPFDHRPSGQDHALLRSSTSTNSYITSARFKLFLVVKVVPTSEHCHVVTAATPAKPEKLIKPSSRELSPLEEGHWVTRHPMLLICQ